jgi:hypothetical protein
LVILYYPDVRILHDTIDTTDTTPQYQRVTMTRARIHIDTIDTCLALGLTNPFIINRLRTSQTADRRSRAPNKDKRAHAHARPRDKPRAPTRTHTRTHTRTRASKKPDRRPPKSTPPPPTRARVGVP